MSYDLVMDLLREITLFLCYLSYCFTFIIKVQGLSRNPRLVSMSSQNT